MTRVLSGGFLAILALSGCFASTEEPLSGLEDGPEAVYIEGVIVDSELVPVEGASVVLDGFEPQMTSAAGSFRIGPVGPGTYELIVEKAGYGPVSWKVTVGSDPEDPVVVQLVPVASDVPYFEIEPHASVIGCAVATPTGRLTCGLVAQTTGATPVPDSSVFGFSIPKDGLAMLLVETAWQPGTAFAQQLSVNVLDQEGDQSNCLTTACYAEEVGDSPIRIEFRPGVRWHEADPYQAFPGESGHGFNLYLMPPFGTPENPVLVFADQRADTFLTFFYNREASSGFSALPDA